jgi:circadian clock protein KaiC
LASSGVSALDTLLADGYPDRSAVLIVGPPGIGKEALGYWFTRAGLVQGDFCLYVTRLPASEVLQDVKGFGIDLQNRVPLWIASEGGQVRLDISDLTALSFNVKDILKKNAGRRMRIVVDVVSSLLMLNQPETVYRFLGQLLADVKQHDAVLLATLEEGMHKQEVLTAMHQLFDGVLEMRLYEEGLRVVPLLRLRKMRGALPQAGYYNFSFTKNGMEINAFGK